MTHNDNWTRNKARLARIALDATVFAAGLALALPLILPFA